MISSAFTQLKADDVYLLSIAVGVSTAITVAIALFLFWRHRVEQRRFQKRIMEALARMAGDEPQMFITEMDLGKRGELIAKFKLPQCKRVVSVLEADGKRFIHVDGDLSSLERAQMMRYLKSEGFIS